ncbi:MAG: tRNA epoxyqueuosine(34) reductase QueG, partial [Gemmatimonadota bacterium]
MPVVLGESQAHAAASRLRSAALRLGFTRVGFAPAEAPRHAAAYLGWLDDGHHGEMAWMARPDAVRRRLDPGEAQDGCRTVIVAALSYAPDTETPARKDSGERNPEQPLVARYARGVDYHDWFETRLEALAAEVRTIDSGAHVRSYVDYGPVLERDHAQRAGLGWIGKNSMLINPELGSWLLLGELLTTLEVEPDPPFVPDHCGTCRRCVDACPTGAILDGRVIDSRRCISYLTIELRGAIPEDLRPAIGNRVFGCDICQDVCPWNSEPKCGDSGALIMGKPAPFPALAAWADELLDMDSDEYRDAYRGTPLYRPGRD